MAELTTLDEKVGEVLGLAMAAQGATDKIKKLVDDDEIAKALEDTHKDAVQIEERCTTLIEGFDGKKTAILEKARETKQEVNEMMSTYLDEKSDGLDGFEFLTMAEAGELGHWAVVGKLNEKARNSELQEVVDWALPLQQEHFQRALDGSLKLASEEDPNETA
jgi:uncharacterized protein YeaC (DUF1315 family)